MSRLNSWFASAVLAGVGALAIASPGPVPGFGSGVAAAIDNGPSKYVCMTDDGYGRLRSCSASYKTANPAWRGGDSCYTDDGYGRYRSCSASYKAKHAK
jgi:hypothetical protein